MKHVFTGKTYGLFELLKKELLADGYTEFQIELRLDHILRSVESAPRGSSTGNPKFEEAFEYFGYILICEIDHSADLIRIVKFDSADR